jgi:predicted DNA-binding transcriptional regulator AlpA
MQQRLIAPQRFVRVADLVNLLGVTRGTIYNWLRRGQLPKPVGGPGRSIRWTMDTIGIWAAQRGIPLSLASVNCTASSILTASDPLPSR